MPFEHASLKLTIVEAQVIATSVVISANGKKAPVSTTVVNKPGSRLLSRLQAVHDPRPEIDHLDRLGQSAKIAHILIEGNLIIFDERRLLGQATSLDVVADHFEIGFFLGRELWLSVTRLFTDKKRYTPLE